LFITGEMSEQTIHVARERDIAFIAAGHHATERFGVQSVGNWLAETFGIDHEFVDIYSPA
jgi:putative NIF3 family GTP cyclohydrolase 1 type 2